jgi:hypothetical protein
MGQCAAFWHSLRRILKNAAQRLIDEQRRGDKDLHRTLNKLQEQLNA